MKVLFTTVFVLFCFVLTLQAEDWTKVRQTIEENNTKIAKGLVTGEINQVMSYYTEDAISLPAFDRALRGIPAIKQKTEQDYLSEDKVTSVDFKTNDLIGSGDLAVEIGEWKLAFITPGSSSPVIQDGKYVFIWQKQADNSWKIKTEIWNTNSYPTMVSDAAGTNKDVMK